MATNSCPELLVVTANCDFFVQFRHMCDNVMFAVDAILTLTYTLMYIFITVVPAIRTRTRSARLLPLSSRLKDVCWTCKYQ